MEPVNTQPPATARPGTPTGTMEVTSPMAATASTPDQIRQAVQTLLAGTGLVMVTVGLDLVIRNPACPDRGAVLVNLIHGGVSWQHQHIDMFGPLEGTTGHETGRGPADRPVPGLMIIHLLTGFTPPRSQEL